MDIDVQCPCVSPAAGQRNTSIDLVALRKDGVNGGVILAVAHADFVV
ncbi:hypothetical protein [Boseongicola aestuarii]|uniref:Uncharacterized protein n=1 Tax=Boseongicola aestuarii TaxID=1470561 RepID=A0A238J2R9_9RHOB|nr:hypothetical protein [Boseongicola aestuarii]SMX24250.1 hypothetical protein BOA8489_02373 [Boseongicola aestuarii]